MAQKPATAEQTLAAKFSRAASRWKARLIGAPVTPDMLNQICMWKRYTDEPLGGELIVAKRTADDSWNLYRSTLNEGSLFRHEFLRESGLSLKQTLNKFAAEPGEGMTYKAQKYNHPASVMKMTGR